MDANVNYFYDAKFEGNISIVGQTGCGKTTFVQSLAKKKKKGWKDERNVLAAYNITFKGQRK